MCLKSSDSFEEDSNLAYFTLVIPNVGALYINRGPTKNQNMNEIVPENPPNSINPRIFSSFLVPNLTA